MDDATITSVGLDAESGGTNNHVSDSDFDAADLAKDLVPFDDTDQVMTVHLSRPGSLLTRSSVTTVALQVDNSPGGSHACVIAGHAFQNGGGSALN